MGKGLRVQVTNAQDGSSFERTFDDFPIRIGRDSLNELALDYAFVSKFHAVLDLRGDRLILRDLGSRNGTTLRVPTERIPPNESIDLAKTDHLFGIATLRFEVAVIEVDRVSSSNLRRARGGSILSVPEGEAPASFVDSVTSSGLGGSAAQGGPEALLADLEAWRAAWGRLYARLSASLASLGAEERVKALAALMKEHPTLAHEPDFRRLAEHLGVPLAAAAPTDGSSREESVALLVLRDLASWYVDSSRPPQSASQLVAFGRKLQDVLDALFVSFIPLRDGLRRFETEFEVQVGVKTQGGRAPADGAKNPAELAASLLDWNDPEDSGRTVRRVFANLMVHNVGLVNGVMRGAAALLEQLAPATLEQELEAERSRGKGGLAVGPWRYRALWEVLKRRHDDLSNEEQERFALLFGADFANAYSALTANARLTKTPELPRQGSRGTTPPPQASRQPSVPPPPPPREGPTGTVVVDGTKRGAR